MRSCRALFGVAVLSVAGSAVANASAFVEDNAPDPVWTYLVEKYDKDGDSKVTAKEHGRGEESFARLDQDQDGFITAADFPLQGRGGRGGRGSKGASKGGKAEKGEDEAQGPQAIVGEPAPDFTLKAPEGGEAVKLSSWTGKRPVALIFGSYT